MAVSVTTRPSTWSAVKNPVVYKLTSTGHGALDNYRIEVEVFKASDDTSLTGGVKFSFSPDADGISYVDVSTVIKAYLSPDWVEPADSFPITNEIEADTFLKFYIKYQELYDSSATSVVDDVANPRFAVLAGLQIPSTNGNNLTDYVPADDTKKFLTVFDRPKVWRGYPFTLSFIHPDGSGLLFTRSQYNSAGALLGSSSSVAMDVTQDDAVNRVNVFDSFVALNAAAKTVKVKLSAKEQLLSDPSFDAGGIGGDWSSVADETPSDAWTNSGGISITATLDDPGTPVLYSEMAFQTLSQEYPAGDYVVKVNAAKSGALGEPIKTVIKLYNSGTPHAMPAYDQDTPYDGSATDFEFGFTASSSFDGIGLQIRRVSELVGSATIFFHSAELLRTVDASEELTIDVEDPCDNPILLFWKNSLGGDSWWMFEYGQEVAYNLSGTKKAKRMTLYADNLTLNQWEAIQELNTIGEVTAENITELTSSINKTAVRDGSQVYIIDEDGNKTGVIVIPVPSVIHTKDVTHSIEIEIEYPERVE